MFKIKLIQGRNLELEESGTILHYLNGSLHRLDGPALETSDGKKYWYKNGLEHRPDGPAVEIGDHYKEWFFEGERHRLDGPSVIWNMHEAWYKEGKKHRLDGPALVNPHNCYPVCHKNDEWWIEGIQYSSEGHWEMVKNNV